MVLSQVPAPALEVRGYSPAQHDRLLDFPGQPSFPRVPKPNPGFVPGSATLFNGIGWPAHATDWTRQMALVSPRHFVYATHYTLGADWQIAFIGADGQQHSFPLQSQTPVINSQGEQTDLMLCTLAAPVPAGLGITPFPALDLSGEADYLGKSMVIFGKNVASTMPVHGFTRLVDDPGFDTTRYAYFDYNRTSGAATDCNYQGGDSGSPVFVMVNGSPAIIGTASGQDPLPNNISRNYVNFIPAYLPQLDALMDGQGYHMKRLNPAATTVGVQISANGFLRRLKAGSAALNVQNTGSAEAHNLTLQLTFSHPPATVAGNGWICEAAGPLVWNCRRGGLAKGSQSTLNATWNSLPDVENLQISTSRAYDGATPATTSVTLPVSQSYTSWIQGTGDPAKDADPDHDGISNLLEYAFGGSPVQCSRLSESGHPLLPHVESSGGRMLLHFTARTDASARGLIQQVEVSNNLETDAWQSLPSAEAIAGTSSDSPPGPGFQLVTVALPADTPAKFMRVKVALAE